MIEKFIVTEGIDRGRIKDIDIAMELAYIEDAWREENNGQPMLNPPERLGKPEIHFRDILNNELKKLILVKLNEEVNQNFDAIYTNATRENDLENSDERWLTYRIASKLSSIGEEHGFDLDTCNEILGMSFAEAYETAYGYLAQAGLDADSILADFTESQ